MRQIKKSKQTREKKHLLDANTRRLIRSMKPIRGWLLLSGLLCAILIGCAVAAPEILGGLIDRLYADTKSGSKDVVSHLLPGLGILLALYGVNAAVTYGNAYLLNTVVTRYYTSGLRMQLSEKLGRLPVSYMDKTPFGDVIDRMMDDVGNMSSIVYNLIEVLMSGFLQMVVIGVVLFFEDWRLALVVVTLSPLSVFLSGKLAALGEKYWHKHFNLGGELFALAEECFTNYPVTKAFNREAAMEEKYAKLNHQHQQNGIAANFLSAIVQPAIVFVDALAYIVIALVGGWLITKHIVPIGTVVTVILFARQMSAPLERIAFGLGESQQVKAASKRVFDLLDLPEEPDAAGTAEQPTRGHVEFDKVCFSYDPEKPLIRDLSMDVQPGQKIAIVGPTGAGKTTIVNLLMRFYDIQSGEIRIDGQNIAELSRAETRKRFAMVLQETWLFKGTVAENVAYGCPDATREQIEEACRSAYCDHFIRALPEGYDTVISEDSTNISSGQKQLLTIARAMLADRSLLILDEATSNVDTRTELLLQKAMDRLMGGRTSFIIAHRLSTIVNADRILVIRDGQIVEQGKHSELLEKRGFYYELFTSQYRI